MEDLPQDSEKFIQEALRSVRLPPRAVRELLELSQQSDVEMQRIADTITSDETLTARVLRLVNSALFGLSQRVSSVQQAVVLLGKESIIQLAIGVAAMTLETSTVDDTSFNREDFWRHGMAVAYIARELGGHCKGVEPEEAFTAGLLHDIGKLVLLSYLGDAYPRIVNTVRLQRQPLHLVERARIGTDHGTISRKLCEKWKLSKVLLDGVSIHDAESPEPQQGRLRALIRTANAVAKSAGVGNSGNRYLSLQELDASLLRAFAQQPDLIRQLPEEVTRIERAFRFDADGASDAEPQSTSTAPVQQVVLQFNDDRLGSVFTILCITLGVDPVPLRAGSSPGSLDGNDVAGWIVDAPPERPPAEGIPLVDAGTWLADHKSANDGAVDVVALREWLREELA